MPINATDTLLQLSQYQLEAKRTAYYPACPPIPAAPQHWRGNLLYCTMGLVGELGEIAEADDKGDLLLEVGDAFWYAANICDSTSDHLNHLWEVGRQLYRTSNRPAETAITAPLNSCKKLWRDGYSQALFATYVQDVAIALGWVDSVRVSNGLDLLAVLQANLDKLAPKAKPLAVN